MLSLRSKLSLCQFLALQEQGFLRATLLKHGVQVEKWHPNGSAVDVLGNSVLQASETALQSILGEIARTQGDLRSRVNPRYRYDERWADLMRCLELDGYRMDGQDLRIGDPTIADTAPLDDDLTAEINRSHLPAAAGIAEVLDKSTEAYRKTPPDYNACLTNARIALQALASGIAKQRRNNHPGSFDDDKWGQVLSYLCKSGFVSKKEEEALAGVFGLVSDGAHVPVGLTEQEMVRLGRSLIISICFFLVKRHNTGTVK